MRLQYDVDLNVIDEYGYTPLVQTAIVNSVNKARHLLNAGAAVDFPDFNKSNCIHWAASNNNYDLCELFLKAGANPNSYTTAGQSVLVTPMLRKHKKLTDLLYRYGASIDLPRILLMQNYYGIALSLKVVSTL